MTTSAIVKADEPLHEQWFMLATARAARPGWRILAARRDLYVELDIPVSESRTQALDRARGYLGNNAHMMSRLYPRHLLIPINYQLAVVEGSAPVADRPEYVPMWPKRMDISGCATEAVGRMRVILGKDKDFARRWSAYRFVPVRIDDAVFIPE